MMINPKTGLEVPRFVRTYNIVGKNKLGFIEDVYGTGTSFNVYKRKSKEETAVFYRSAYTLEKAQRLLKELWQ